jgi:hypothetical protein
MIVYATASICSVDPSTSRRELNCVSHSRRLSTATGAGTGGASSLGVKYRPITGGASKKPKKLALTTATLCSCVSAPTPTASVLRDTPAVRESVLDHLARSM